MPTFAFLSRRALDTSLTQRKLEVLARLGHPYTRGADRERGARTRAPTPRAIAASLRRDGIALDERRPRRARRSR